MSKQIKLGFDKTSARSFTSDRPMVDVRGERLRDQAGNSLYTTIYETPTLFSLKKNSASTHVNNEASPTTDPGKSVSVVEQFPTLSEVSNTLLGIPRLGKQQSLFADVSVYGQDVNTWEFYSVPRPNEPIEWSTRKNPTHGDRYYRRLQENATQQSLSIQSFPVSWTYPYGPNWQNRYDPEQFALYKNFVRLGNILHAQYYPLYPEYADAHFLPVDAATVVGAGENADVIYNNDFQLAMNFIETWTLAWMDIRDGARLRKPTSDPISPFFTASELDNTTLVSLNFSFGETRPGYSSTRYQYCQLESKEAFRYQPGAISGFTFGVKPNIDQNSFSNVLEWGCANQTDQFMFQLSGSNLNIIRRSVIPLSDESLAQTSASGKIARQEVVDSPNPFEQPNSIFSLSAVNTRELYETVYTQENFNGDPLNGTGNSEYNISIDTVTMFKIEFSWYGAIGAKFYAYVPVGNDQARWVRLHTIIIENMLDNPSLNNPYMKFRYSLYLTDTSSLRNPVYLHKYGASYYIDGGDDGTYNYNNYFLDAPKEIIRSNSASLIGLLPKNSIKSSTGVEIKNQKNFFINELSVTSDRDARLDFIECEGCEGGFGQYYAPGIANSISSQEENYIINENNELLYATPGNTFSKFSGYKKIISDGIYSSFVKYPESQGDTSDYLEIYRRKGTSQLNVPIDNEGFTNEYTYVDGEVIQLPPPAGETFAITARLTGYHDLVASTRPLTKNKITVHFLNPIIRENTSQVCEFLIGVTEKQPSVNLVESAEYLQFDDEFLDLDQELYAEFTNFTTDRDLQGVETAENPRGRYGAAMQQDPRLPQPKGQNSGICSSVDFYIDQVIYTNASYTTVNPVSGAPGEFLIFNQNAGDVIGGAIGVFTGNIYEDSGSTFLTTVESYVDELQNLKFFAEISPATLPDFDMSSIDRFSLKTLTVQSRHIDKSKALSFDVSALYMFFATRDNATINNIVVEETEGENSFTHLPQWIGHDQSNITVISPGNSSPPSTVTDYISGTNEYIGTDGMFYMGGYSGVDALPGNYLEKNRLDSLKYDTQLSLPIRPGFLKTSFFVSGNKTNTIDMTHIFAMDRYKLTPGSFNNKSLYITAKTSDPTDTTVGNIKISVAGKEQ